MGLTGSYGKFISSGHRLSWITAESSLGVADVDGVDKDSPKLNNRRFLLSDKKLKKNF
jgi:hypothetical protein